MITAGAPPAATGEPPSADSATPFAAGFARFRPVSHGASSRRQCAEGHVDAGMVCIGEDRCNSVCRSSRWAGEGGSTVTLARLAAALLVLLALAAAGCGGGDDDDGGEGAGQGQGPAQTR